SQVMSGLPEVIGFDHSQLTLGRQGHIRRLLSRLDGKERLLGFHHVASQQEPITPKSSQKSCENHNQHSQDISKALLRMLAENNPVEKVLLVHFDQQLI